MVVYKARGARVNSVLHVKHNISPRDVLIYDVLTLAYLLCLICMHPLHMRKVSISSTSNSYAPQHASTALAQSHVAIKGPPFQLSGFTHQNCPPCQLNPVHRAAPTLQLQVACHRHPVLLIHKLNLIQIG